MGIIGVTARVLWRQQVVVTSRAGFINAPITTLSAPISGTLYLESLEPGSAVLSSQQLGLIRNDRNPQLEADRQNLQSRLSLAQSQERASTSNIALRQAQIASLQASATEQRSLETNLYSAMIESRQGAVIEAQLLFEQAEREVQRYEGLLAEGAVSLQEVEEKRSRYSQLQQVVVNRTAELRQEEVRLQAANQGLQLDAGRSFSFAEIRLIDLNREVDDLEQDRQYIQESILTLQAELQAIESQLDLQQNAAIVAPQNGVVWSVEHYSGSTGIPVIAGASIIELVNCEQIWVSAFVNERNAGQLQVGQTAGVKLINEANLINNGQNQLIGQITAIRSGVNNPVQDIAIPPNDQARQEVEVRLELLEPTFDNHEFCGVGQNVTVTFHPA